MIHDMCIYIYIFCMYLYIIMSWHRYKTYTYMTPPNYWRYQNLHQHGEIHWFFSAFVDQGPRSRKWMVHRYTPIGGIFRKRMWYPVDGSQTSSDHVPINTSIYKGFPIVIPGGYTPFIRPQLQDIWMWWGGSFSAHRQRLFSKRSRRPAVGAGSTLIWKWWMYGMVTLQ